MFTIFRQMIEIQNSRISDTTINALTDLFNAQNESLQRYPPYTNTFSVGILIAHVVRFSAHTVLTSTFSHTKL